MGRGVGCAPGCHYFDGLINKYLYFFMIAFWPTTWYVIHCHSKKYIVKIYTLDLYY